MGYVGLFVYRPTGGGPAAVLSAHGICRSVVEDPDKCLLTASATNRPCAQWDTSDSSSTDLREGGPPLSWAHGIRRSVVEDSDKCLLTASAVKKGLRSMGYVGLFECRPTGRGSRRCLERSRYL
jgi:hypothetical protein